MEEYYKLRGHTCPFCKENELNTSAKVPFVRGMLIVFQYGSKNFIGCVRCVRIKILKEIGLSLLIGWFSPKALFSNPFVIIYNFFVMLFLSPNKDKVNKHLNSLGVNDKEVSISKVACALAVNIINADGKVENEEIEVAENIGAKLFEEFNAEELRSMLKQDVPDIKNLSLLLKDILTEKGKRLVVSYLVAISNADNFIDDREMQMINEVISVFEIELDDK